MANTLSLNPGAWSFEQYQKFMLSFARTEWEKVLPELDTIIVSWTYDIPWQAGAWKKLPFTELKQVVDSVGTTLGAFAEGMDTSDVTVDLTKWTMEQFLEFRAISRKSDFAGFERMLAQIAHVKGYVKGERFTCVQGVKVTKAVKAAQDALFAKGE